MSDEDFDVMINIATVVAVVLAVLLVLPKMVSSTNDMEVILGFVITFTLVIFGGWRGWKFLKTKFEE